MRVRIAILALVAAVSAFAAAPPVVVAVDVDGVVHPITTEILTSAIAEARDSGAALLLLRLNTPGGLMDAMRESIEKIVASPVPVAAFVTPSGGRAASAGFFLLLSADVAAMAPATNTGAAHPVIFGTQMDPVMRQKLENDAAASLRSLAGKRGRNSALAEKAVLESKSFTDKEALENHLIDLVARDDQDLLAQLDLREVARFDGRRTVLHTAGAVIRPYHLTPRQRIISSIADPNLALVMLVLGALGIYVEFSSPGLIAPGVIGGILVLLGLSAISVLPVSWTGAALLILALALFVLEAKFTSHGILGIGGAVAMVLGAVMLIDSPSPELRIRWSTAIAVTLPFSFITVVLLSLALRARRNKVQTGVEGMIGEVGVVLTPLAPNGKVIVRGEYWDAGSATSLPEGARVRVTRIDGLKLTVEPLAETNRGMP